MEIALGLVVLIMIVIAWKAMTETGPRSGDNISFYTNMPFPQAFDTIQKTMKLQAVGLKRWNLTEADQNGEIIFRCAFTESIGQYQNLQREITLMVTLAPAADGQTRIELTYNVIAVMVRGPQINGLIHNTNAMIKACVGAA
jgi:hypothetical protein